MWLFTVQSCAMRSRVSLAVRVSTKVISSSAASAILPAMPSGEYCYTCTAHYYAGRIRSARFSGGRQWPRLLIPESYRAFQFGQKSFDSIRFDSHYRIDFFDSIRFANLINFPLLHWYSNSNDGEFGEGPGGVSLRCGSFCDISVSIRQFPTSYIRLKY